MDAYNELNTRYKVFEHVVSACVLPLLDVGTDVLLMYDLFTYNNRTDENESDTFPDNYYNDEFTDDNYNNFFNKTDDFPSWIDDFMNEQKLSLIDYVLLFLLAMAGSTIARIYYIYSHSAENCPRGSKTLCVLMHVLQIHPLYYVWCDVANKKKGEESFQCLASEIGFESTFASLLNLMLRMEKYDMEINNDLSFVTSFISLANGGVTLTISQAYQSNVPGFGDFISSWRNKLLYVVYFLSTGFLTFFAYGAFYHLLNSKTWFIMLPSLLIVRPLAAKMCGILNDDELKGVFRNILSSPLWVFLGLPFNFGPLNKWGKNMIMFGVLSLVEAWAVVALAIATVPAVVFNRNELIMYIIISVVKCATGCCIYSQWAQALSTEEVEEQSTHASPSTEVEGTENMANQLEETERATLVKVYQALPL